MQEDRAIEEVRREYSADDVRGLNLAFIAHRRSATLVYVPAYLFSYVYGEHQYGTLEILSQRHQALVAGCAQQTSCETFAR